MGGANHLLDIKGVQVSYYFICHTKLWLFSHNAQMERESDSVAVGKLVHEESYQREKRELSLGSINVDFYKRGDEIVIHEVKKSRKLEESHRYQLLYYLYYLKQRGIDAKGVINYPLLRRTLDVALVKEEESFLETALRDVQRIISLDAPPKPEKKPYCARCSYYEFCWVS